MANPFDSLRITPTALQKSQNWYRTQVGTLSNLQRRVDTSLAQSRLTKNPEIGSLYLFQYDPLHKDQLPYYDTLPLVFPFNSAPGGFLGLNLHYLPYGLRFNLMKALLDLTERGNRQQISWQLLSSSSRYYGATGAVKHYLSTQIRSNFLKIPEDQWLAASQMPTERFVGTGKQTVFKNTRKIL